MSDSGSPEQAVPNGPKEKYQLQPGEVRVLASLIEKEITTPEYYPLTLKALTAACNQKSNRSPVMALEESEVMDALDTLRYERNLVWQVDQAGSRTPKYRHALLDAFRFSPRELAIICELMLRGPQTQGELRTHCSRLARFASLDEVRDSLRELEDWDGTRLILKLPAGPGRREVRYAHLLCRPDDIPEAAETAKTAHDPSPPADHSSRDARLEALEEEVAVLRGELDELRAALDGFRRQFE